MTICETCKYPQTPNCPVCEARERVKTAKRVADRLAGTGPWVLMFRERNGTGLPWRRVTDGVTYLSYAAAVHVGRMFTEFNPDFECEVQSGKGEVNG